MSSFSYLRRRLTGLRQRADGIWIRHVGSRLGTHRDPVTGLLYQEVSGNRVFVRSRQDYLDPNLLTWLCSNIYFKFYQPTSQDVVVDVGVGYGHEAFYLLARSPGVKYFGIEVQPSVYENLCNSFRAVPGQCKAICVAVSKDEDRLYISSTAKYTKATTVENGYIEIPALPWDALLTRYGIERVDLLKVNIEGAERMLLPSIGDMSGIKRVIISAHDFRAENGEGEQFRTHEFVKNYLFEQGYRVRLVDERHRWLRHWLYADREQ